MRDSGGFKGSFLVEYSRTSVVSQRSTEFSMPHALGKSETLVGIRDPTFVGSVTKFNDDQITRNRYKSNSSCKS